MTRHFSVALPINSLHQIRAELVDASGQHSRDHIRQAIQAVDQQLLYLACSRCSRVAGICLLALRVDKAVEKQEVGCA